MGKIPRCGLATFALREVSMGARKFVMQVVLAPLVRSFGWSWLCLVTACSGGLFNSQDAGQNSKVSSDDESEELGAEAPEGGDANDSVGALIDPQVEDEFEPADKPGMVSGAMLTCVSLLEPERDDGQ